MTNEAATDSTAVPSLQATQVYMMAAVCLIVGLAIGYLFRGLPAAVSPTQTAVAASPSGPARAMSVQSAPGMPTMKQVPDQQSLSAPHAVPLAQPRAAMNTGSMPSLEEMKHMADKQAEPLLEKLKADPRNTAVLTQVAAIYHTTHQFKEAAQYYEKAVQVEPGNVAIRTKLAASLYRNGDVDEAIAELNRALSYDPNDANSLFNLGLIRLQGKQDGRGALAAWQHLLKANPQLSAERKATVQKLMANVLTSLGEQHVRRSIDQ